MNGDGYADLVAGAPGYSSDTGKVYVYHGSVYGLNIPFSEFAGESAGDTYGASVGTAGDENGDGYADLIVGAPGHSSGRGKAYIYRGGLIRLATSATWKVDGISADDDLGYSVGTAGDLDGDGYADFVIGVPGKNSDTGEIRMFYGNGGNSRPGLTQLIRGDGSTTPVQSWGVSYNPDGFQVTLRTTHPLGRGGAKIQVQVCPASARFGDSSCRDQISTTWVEAASPAGTLLEETITGLERGTLYRWRARILYDSHLTLHTPWRRFLGQAMEADVRSAMPGCDLAIQKSITPTTSVTPGTMITYTLAFSVTGGPAADVTITDILPGDISSVSVVNSGAIISDTGASPGYVWQVQDLAPGEGGVITITGVAETNRFINTAVITTASPDIDPTNNTSTVQTHIPGIIFVDVDAEGSIHDGLSWLSAYTNLNDGLAVAVEGDEIWVAEGTYIPNNVATRAATFQLTDGIGIFGGFTGEEVWRHERDWTAHPTILSGDTGTLGNDSDNTYHVISASNLVTPTILDGFTVVGGKADGAGADSMGAGMVNSGDNTLINVIFSGNAASGDGGALYNAGGDLVLIDVAFSGNTAGNDGGGLFTANADNAQLTHVTFSSNAAGHMGGGLYNDDGEVTVQNSILWGNTAMPGGSQIYATATATTTVNYSDVQGGWTGTGNMDADPDFYDVNGLDDALGTLDDDLRLRYTSAVIDQGDNSAIPEDTFDLNGNGVFTDSLPLDLSGRDRLIGFTVVVPVVDMGAYEANVLDVIADANALYALGSTFRMEHVQLLPADTMAQALQNYKDFNEGELFYDFCADYFQIDEHGYCPDDPDRLNVRNVLLDAIKLYSVAQKWPTDNWTTHDGQEIEVQQIGGSGVASAAQEIANVHLIFGNEFLVDAIDYRFSIEGIPYADVIIDQELEELGEAKRQFELAMGLLFMLFDEYECTFGQYCSIDHLETFGVASSRMMTTLDEMAARYRMLGDDQAALGIYDRAYTEQYMQLAALAQVARTTGIEYLQNGSWEMFNNLSRMRDLAQTIRDGLDFFGFAPDYVPLQSFDHLLELTEGATGNTGLLGTARDLEDQARGAQRTYDANATNLAAELKKLTASYNGQLYSLCGLSGDQDGDGLPDYDPCEGGLIQRNFFDLDAASLRVGLAWMKAQDIVERIQIEQNRVEQVIQIDLGLTRQISVIDLAVSKLNAYKESYTQLGAAEHKIAAGFKASADYYVQTEVKGSINPLASGAEAKSGLKVTLGTYVGYEASARWVSSASVTWVPNVEKIGEWQNIKTLQQAEARAQILNANSEATIRNLLIQQSQALIEYEIAQVAFHKLAAEHNQLAGRVAWYLNKRAQAADKVAKYNSHLLSPAYRIMRDTLTIQSAEAHDLAAQFAYLTARAAEYELLTPYPDLDAIYRARTSNDIRLFLDDLTVWYQALNLPGQLNRYPYTISIAKDVLGFTDQNLDPTGRLSPEERDQMRYTMFQEYLESQFYIDGRLEFWFSTALDQRRTETQYLFSPNIWNNRIAGIGAPLAQNEGVSLNIVTRQTGDVGDPEVVLIHDGQTSYRNAAEEIVYYDPDTAIPVGYLLPEELDPENTTVVLRPAINGVGAIANSGLINLSVSASSWTFRIPSDSKGNLDFSQIEDIEIYLDTSGRALSGFEPQADSDAMRLQSGLEMESVAAERLSLRVDRLSSGPVNTVPAFLLAPNTAGIRGSYYGSVIVTSPMTLALQVLNFNLVNEGGTLSGTLNVSETALYNGEVGIHGMTDGEMFTVTSEVITNTVLGLPVERMFTLVGHSEEGGRILKATYTAVVENLLCDPVIEYGVFSASRPDTPGSDSLKVEAVNRSLPLRGSTQVTVSLVNTLMQPITETTRITLTSDLGGMTPPVVDMVDGVAVLTFQAGETMGEAVLSATNGEITGTTTVDIEGNFVYSVYLPLIRGGSVAGTPDLVVQEITATENDVQITIKNGGNGAVTDAFWVDVYIDPVSAPTGTNQIWNALADEGLVWGVLTLMEPDDVIVLTVGDAQYRDLLSHASWPLIPDTLVYVQVDSWNMDTTYGAVLESHEIADDPYENNIAYTYVNRDGVGINAFPTSENERPFALTGDLPPRSERTGNQLD